MSQSIAFTVPLLPGRTQQDREVMRACQDGEHRAGHDGSRRRLGIARESVWLQSTPAGDVAVVYLEAHDIGQALAQMATSDDPFDRFFRRHVLDVHGVDLAQGFPPPEPLLDYRADVSAG